MQTEQTLSLLLFMRQPVLWKIVNCNLHRQINTTGTLTTVLQHHWTLTNHIISQHGHSQTEEWCSPNCKIFSGPSKFLIPTLINTWDMGYLFLYFFSFCKHNNSSHAFTIPCQWLDIDMFCCWCWSLFPRHIMLSSCQNCFLQCHPMVKVKVGRLNTCQ